MIRLKTKIKYLTIEVGRENDERKNELPFCYICKYDETICTVSLIPLNIPTEKLNDEEIKEITMLVKKYKKELVNEFLRQMLVS